MVRLYDIKSSNPNPVQQFEGHTNNITGVAFHCEGKWMVTSSEDMTVRVWDTRTGMVQRNYQHSHPVNDVVIHPNQGELVSCDRGGNIRIWDLGESKCTHQLVPVEDVSMASVSVASDGSLLAAGNNLVCGIISEQHQTQLTFSARAMSTSGECTRTTTLPPSSPAESSKPTKTTSPASFSPQTLNSLRRAVPTTLSESGRST